MKIKAVSCEIYSRVVGYYRPVQDFNLGKKEEYSLRHTMSPEEMAAAASYPFPDPVEEHPAEIVEAVSCVS